MGDTTQSMLICEHCDQAIDPGEEINNPCGRPGFVHADCLAEFEDDIRIARLQDEETLRYGD